MHEVFERAMPFEKPKNVTSLLVKHSRAGSSFCDLSVYFVCLRLQTRAPILNHRLVENANLFQPPFGSIWKFNAKRLVEPSNVLAFWRPFVSQGIPEVFGSLLQSYRSPFNCKHFHSCSRCPIGHLLISIENPEIPQIISELCGPFLGQ